MIQVEIQCDTVIQGVIQCDTGRGGKSTNLDFGVVVVHNWQLIFVHTPEPAGSCFAQLDSFESFLYISNRV